MPSHHPTRRPRGQQEGIMGMYAVSRRTREMYENETHFQATLAALAAPNEARAVLAWIDAIERRYA